MPGPRFTNEDKNDLRDHLIIAFQRHFGLSEEEAAKTVTTGSRPMYIDLACRIVHNTDYATTKSYTIEDVERAMGEWIMYKAGVRPDEKE